MNAEAADAIPVRWSKSSFWLPVVVEFFLACVCFLLASCVFFADSSDRPLIQAIVACCVGLLGLSRASLRLKYKHSLFTPYAVSPSGISALGNGGNVHVRWDQVVRAEYMPVFPLYRLWSNELPRPIVLLEMGGWGPGRTSARQRERALSFLHEGLKTRLKKRWLPW
jgi:hypothetical protein